MDANNPRSGERSNSKFTAFDVSLGTQRIQPSVIAGGPWKESETQGELTKTPLPSSI